MHAGAFLVGLAAAASADNVVAYPSQPLAGLPFDVIVTAEFSQCSVVLASCSGRAACSSRKQSIRVLPRAGPRQAHSAAADASLGISRGLLLIQRFRERTSFEVFGQSLSTVDRVALIGKDEVRTGCTA